MPKSLLTRFDYHTTTVEGETWEQSMNRDIQRRAAERKARSSRDEIFDTWFVELETQFEELETQFEELETPVVGSDGTDVPTSAEDHDEAWQSLVDLSAREEHNRKMFECHHCHQKVRRDEIRKHVDRCRQKVRCNHCGGEFPRHEIMEHARGCDAKQHRPSSNEWVFFTDGIGIQQAGHPRTTKCKVCAKEVEGEIIEHLKREHPRTTKCKVCAKEVEGNIIEHLKREHPRAKKTEDSAHEKSEVKPRERQCSRCGKPYSTTAFGAHARKCRGDR